MVKNILLITESLTNGGSERALANIANELCNFYNVHIIISDDKNITYEIDKKIKITCINELMSRNPFKRIYGIYKLKNYKYNHNIKTSISFITSFNLFNCLSRYEDKVIISIRNHLSTKKESKIARLSTILSNKICDLIVCCSKSVQLDQINNFKAKKKKTIVIENFCAKYKYNNEDKDNIICTIGRLVEHKGQIHIINAMKYVIKEVNDAKLIILGKGPYKERLEKRIKELKLDKNISLIGFKSNVDHYLNKSKVFVLTSYYEGFSNSLLEAMSSGIPVIATDCPGGNKELLKDEKNNYGILIPDFNNKSIDVNKNEILLSKEIIKLIKEKEIYEKYSKKALNRSKEYSKEIIIDKWKDII